MAKVQMCRRIMPGQVLCALCPDQHIKRPYPEHYENRLITGGEGEEIVKENQLGLVSAPGDYEGLSKNIRAMSHLPDEEYRQLKANCLRVSQTTFCFERQLEVYKRFLSAF